MGPGGGGGGVGLNSNIVMSVVYDACTYNHVYNYGTKASL